MLEIDINVLCVVVYPANVGDHVHLIHVTAPSDPQNLAAVRKGLLEKFFFLAYPQAIAYLQPHGLSSMSIVSRCGVNISLTNAGRLHPESQLGALPPYGTNLMLTSRQLKRDYCYTFDTRSFYRSDKARRETGKVCCKNCGVISSCTCKASFLTPVGHFRSLSSSERPV